MLTSVPGSALQDDYIGVRPEYQALSADTYRAQPGPAAKPSL